MTPGAPKYVHIGWLVDNLGFSPATWRRLAEIKFVRAGKLCGTHAKLVFDREHCESQLARVVSGEILFPSSAPTECNARTIHKQFREQYQKSAR